MRLPAYRREQQGRAAVAAIANTHSSRLLSEMPNSQTRKSLPRGRRPAVFFWPASSFASRSSLAFGFASSRARDATVAHVLVVELAGAHLWLSIPAVVIQVFWSG